MVACGAGAAGSVFFEVAPPAMVGLRLCLSFLIIFCRNAWLRTASAVRRAAAACFCVFCCLVGVGARCLKPPAL